MLISAEWYLLMAELIAETLFFALLTVPLLRLRLKILNFIRKPSPARHSVAVGLFAVLFSTVLIFLNGVWVARQDIAVNVQWRLNSDSTYLSGFVLLFAIILYQVVHLTAEIVDAEITRMQAKNNASAFTTVQEEKQALAVKVQEQAAELDTVKKALAAAERNLTAVKKQADSTSAEYLRLTDELSRSNSKTKTEKKDE